MSKDLSPVIELSTELGKLLLENGAETYRVEDTVYRVASHYGAYNVNVYAVPNTIMISAEDTDHKSYSRLLRVNERDTNLGKVRLGNELSRQIVSQDLSLEEAQDRLDDIFNQPRTFSVGIQYFGAALLCGMFTALFGDINIQNIIAGFICGGTGFFVYNYVNSLTNIQFFSEMISAFVIGWLAFLLISLSFGENINIIILSSVMPLVPGRAITNGFRDLMANDFVSGTSILADALLTAAAIGIGVAGVLAII